MIPKKAFIVAYFLLFTFTNKLHADARSWTALGCGIAARSALKLVYLSYDAPNIDTDHRNIQINRPLATHVVGLLTGLYITHRNYQRMSNEKKNKSN